MKFSFIEWLVFIRDKCDLCGDKKSTCFTNKNQYCYECFKKLMKTEYLIKALSGGNKHLSEKSAEIIKQNNKERQKHFEQTLEPLTNLKP